MNYIGSKHSLLEFLDSAISDTTQVRRGVFCDLFAGTGAVGLHFKKKGFSVISNDIQSYSYAMNKHQIENHKPLQFDGLIKIMPELKSTELESKGGLVCDWLNSLPLKEGFIYDNYSLGGTKGKTFERLYFSDYNAKKCDTIRNKIDEWEKEKLINDNEYWFLLASLLECVDKVANTASVYGAFLKKLKKSAQNDFVLKPMPLYINDNTHSVYNMDANELVKEIEADIMYIDPPYNHRQYSSNYHILETIALNDNPVIRGKTGLRAENTKSSNYCLKRQVKKEFAELIKNVKAKYIFVSYNNEGLLSEEGIREILETRGEYGIYKKEYKRFQADLEANRNIAAGRTIEYLHYVKCS